ncbi:MAG: DNA/RNA helicase domain-containing protein [Gemmatimonadales bacterium]
MGKYEPVAQPYFSSLLVGGGQEINVGEDGIAGWLDAVLRRFPHWEVFISTRLDDSEYAAMASIDELAHTATVRRDPALHLAVSMRSFRAERVSDFVKAVLDVDVEGAHKLMHEVSATYPLAITRDLDAAKRWIRSHARGNERYGLVASSQAMRLKPHAIDVRVKIDPVHWFLNDRADTRSSYYLEDPATEFQIQGLELDWVCVTWDADLRKTRQGWDYFRFRGDRWENRHTTDAHRFLLNAYRVLLTRARQGMVIFVPPGDTSDPTRPPEFYDATFGYLSDLDLEPV